MQMMKHRNLVGIAVIAAAVSLSACGSTPTSGSSATTSSGGSGNLCGALVNESGSANKLSTNIGKSLASGNFSAAQQTLKSSFAQLGQDVAKVESKMSSAPANVQSALQVYNNWLGQTQTAISSATSLQGLTQSLSSLGSDTQLAAASKTVDAYITSQCGNITTTT
jgi:hypothetical protein